MLDEVLAEVLAEADRTGTDLLLVVEPSGGMDFEQLYA